MIPNCCFENFVHSLKSCLYFLIINKHIHSLKYICVVVVLKHETGSAQISTLKLEHKKNV